MTNLHSTNPGEKVVVIGAGIVGCATALTLARKGMRVTVIDPGPIAGGASFGNSGAWFPQAYPLAQPVMPMRIPGMLLNPNGPLTIHPSQLISNFPWFLKFLRECARSNAEANSRALYALTGEASRAWKELIEGTDIADMPRSIGWLKVYSTEKGYEDAKAERGFFDRRGEPYEKLEAEELRQMEPALAPIFKKAVFYPTTTFIPNPHRFALGVANAAKEAGVTFLAERAVALDIGEDIQIQTDQTTHSADWSVLCAGAFSRNLARQAGANPDLVAERGYHAMFDAPEQGLNRQVLWGEHNMVLCPMEHGVRLTTQSEFAGLDAQPNFTRIQRLTERAKEALPGLNTSVRELWMGRRPSTPDSLPYLGPSPKTPRVWFNFGHNHLGLTLAAITAEIVSKNVGIPSSAAHHSTLSLSAYRALR